MCIFVGGDLGMIVRSGWGLFRVGFLVLVMFVWSCGRQRTTLLDMDGLSCEMCRDLVCFAWRGGWRYFVSI